MSDLALGVIGLNFGAHHVRTIANLEGVQLAAVADANETLAARHAAQYRVKAYRDGAEMIAREALDGVVIATPPATRRLLLEAAAAKGVPAFVEKPWALVLREVAPHMPPESWVILEHVGSVEESRRSTGILKAAAQQAGVELA